MSATQIEKGQEVDVTDNPPLPWPAEGPLETGCEPDPGIYWFGALTFETSP